MKNKHINKRKLFNDPIYGFISLPYDILFDIIEHPYFQRLRRIKQLGLTHLVYPGALHTRFHHALGAMHLCNNAIEVLRSKGNKITEAEAKATLIAILLHDIGHGPFSHALEHSIVKNVTHEDLSAYFMKALNKEFHGQLSKAISIFENSYSKTFLHQLIASQLDMDRLDYLKRDSFYAGVSEGIINSDRIISMLNVREGNLVVESKGIYSIEKFIIARRLMYWQVYLHKTVISAENLVVNIFKRAKELATRGEQLNCTEALSYFLYNSSSKKSFASKSEALEQFSRLDDYDLMAAIKNWTSHSDKTLATLCLSLLNRNLYKVNIREVPFTDKDLNKHIRALKKHGIVKQDVLKYFVFTDSIRNNAYQPKKDKINLLYKDERLVDIAKAADLLNINALAEEVKKHFLCYPKQIMVNNLKD